MARGQSLFRNANRIMDGRLLEVVEEYRRADISWAGIARILSESHGVEVSPETLRTWATKHPTPNGEKAAS